MTERSRLIDRRLCLQIDAYLDAWQFAEAGVLRTGSYLSYVGPDGPLRNAANAAFLARIVNQLDPSRKNRYDCWAEYTARVIVGDGRRSYLVGANKDPPTRPQHRVRHHRATLFHHAPFATVQRFTKESQRIGRIMCRSLHDTLPCECKGQPAAKSVGASGCPR